MIEAVTLEIVVMNKDALTNIYHPQHICGRFIKFVKILKFYTLERNGLNGDNNDESSPGVSNFLGSFGFGGNLDRRYPELEFLAGGFTSNFLR